MRKKNALRDRNKLIFFSQNIQIIAPIAIVVPIFCEHRNTAQVVLKDRSSSETSLLDFHHRAKMVAKTSPASNEPTINPIVSALQLLDRQNVILSPARIR